MSSRDHHPVCPCGRELADECMCPRGDPLGSMRAEPYDGPTYEGFEQDEPERVDEEYSDDEFR